MSSEMSERKEEEREVRGVTFVRDGSSLRRLVLDNTDSHRPFHNLLR